MIPVVYKKAMQELDAHMIDNLLIPSCILMENAAFGITSAISAKFSKNTKIVAVCGTGNNGGDGFAAARQLSAKGYDVCVCLVGSKNSLTGDAAANAAFFGERIIEINDEYDARLHFENLCGCVVIDAIFGIGLSRQVTGLYAFVMTLLNSSGAYIIACDIPSGIHSDSGAVLGTAVRANETVTFQCAKPGHFLYPGRDFTGNLIVKEIGVSGNFDLGDTYAYSDGLYLQKRGADTHKGSYGKLACVVSSQGFSGAGILCVCGALKAGAGLVTAGIPSCMQPVFSTRVTESMTFALADFSGSLSENCLSGLDMLIQGKTALAAGPGISTGDGVKKAVAHMVQNYNIKKVFDADALNVIALNPRILENKQGDIILTPHLVEFSRLCRKEPDVIREAPIETAKAFANSYNVTLLLKGATTIVTDGARTALVLCGTPGMAKGGSGDVLTGVIGGLLCGGKPGGMDCFTAALYGAYICGKAGEAAAERFGEYSMTTADTLGFIPQITKEMTL
ncbi:MAG: NAD(P)H-hydrate dehydratase [Christensenellales bacterium]|jgi:hydroxyethylthiazole kinase-like uncharacterized protein yjeF